MSILSSFASDLWVLLFPPRCPVCGGLRSEGTRAVCTHCRMTAPLTHFWEEFDNPMTRRLWGLVPVVHASALLYFVEGGAWRESIHAFKYRGAWLLARDLGHWFGGYLADSGLYDDVQVVIPVPLHWRKRMQRGYNQAEYLAEGVAAELGVGVERGNLVRRRHNPAQARTAKSERWTNVEEIFAVRRPERLAGRHILLMDDVFTTGATIVSCADALLHSVPGCRISIATLAVSKHELGLDH